jgi:hypothetical protein
VKSARLQLVGAGEAALPKPEWFAPWEPGKLHGGTWLRADGTVDSVQWLDLPGHPPLDLASLETLYFRWVPALTAGLVRPRAHPDGRLSIGIEPWHWPQAIRMAPPHVGPGERVRPIEGGLLADAGGSIGFLIHPYPDGARLIVALRALRPRLPKWLYFRIQAAMHERSTFAFLREVRRALPPPSLRAPEGVDRITARSSEPRASLP